MSPCDAEDVVLTRQDHKVAALAFPVGAYVKRGKNDATDAEAICEAVTRPNMRFVPVKSACSRQPTPRSARISTYPGCSDPEPARTEHLLRCAK